MWCIVELQLAADEDDPPTVSAVYGPFPNQADAYSHYFGDGTKLRELAEQQKWPDWLLIGQQLVSVMEMDHPMRVLEGGK